MKIGIDVTCWSNNRGYGRYARGLVTAILENTGEHDYFLFTDNHTHTNLKSLFPDHVEVVVVDTDASPSDAASAAERRSLRDMWAMALAVGNVPLDLMFFPSTYTYYPVFTKARLLVGVHDDIAESYPELVFPERKRRFLWNLKNWLARRQADIIVTVSDHAQQRIVTRFKFPQERTWVVGEAADPVFQPPANQSEIDEALAPYGLVGRSYLVSLGGLNPHKNLAMIIEILADLRREPDFADLHLLLVGPAETDIFTPGVRGVRSLIQSLALEDAIHLTGFIPDEEVALLLAGAEALVMPSLVEGFGLGAVEAAACGTPVVATNISPLPQLLAGGGYFLDPLQPEEWKKSLRSLLSNEAARQEMGVIALHQARKLTWAKTAEQFNALLDMIERGEA